MASSKKKKYSFAEYNQENPVTDKEQTYITITGIVTIILYYTALIFPFVSSWWKGKIGINTLNNDKYNLVSTALRWSNKSVRVIIILLLISTMFLYNQKGFFKKDVRLLIPLFSIIMAISMITMTYVIPERFILHNVVAVLGIVAAVLVVYLIDYIYNDKFEIQN